MDSSDTESSTSTSSSSSSSQIAILSAEIKDLRNKIMSVKKSVTKGDKKQKKAIQDEVTALESLLASKQEELQKLKDSAGAGAGFSVKTEITGEIDNLTNSISKARLKKERRKEEKAVEWEANRQAALQEIASRPDLALQESKSFDRRLAQEGFRIVEVAADGHCLFSAIGCQLDPPMDHWELRAMAAKYLLEHRDEYENFIELDSIDIINSPSTDKYQEYCRKLESTGMWGGQIELEVLSRSLGVCVTVLQAEGPELVFNGEAVQKIYLSYHRFAFSLGEHYNALVKE